MNIACGIATTEREQPTLESTLHSLAIAGFDGGWVSIDGDDEGDKIWDLVLATGGWTGIYNPHQMGCYRNWKSLASWMLMKDAGHGIIKRTQATHFLICEDDIEVSKNLRNYLERTELQEGVISLYTGSVNHSTPGWNRVTDVPKKVHGALCTLWTPELLRDFLHFDKDSEFKHGTDHRIGMFCKLNKVPFWCHTPSFVRHTGVTSAIDPMWDESQQEFRQCKEWLSDASLL